LPILLSLLPALLRGDTSYQVDFVSRYIWRGFDLNPEKEPVFQPSLEYEFGESGLSMNLWMSFSFVNKELNETDLTLSYTQRLLEKFSLQAGLIHYAWYFTPHFQFEDDTSHEIFAGLGMPEVFFQPAVTLFYDFTNGDGIYVLMESEYSFEPMRDVETSIHASLGYNGGQWLPEGEEPGFSDLNIGVSLSYALNAFRILPFANYTFVFLDAIGKQNHFWVGISLIYHPKKY
jgi:uncharacterized protein (TIGR02001 family)